MLGEVDGGNNIPLVWNGMIKHIALSAAFGLVHGQVRS